MDEYQIVNIVICYNNGPEVVNYIDQLKNHREIKNVCFVVVVNSWTNDDSKHIREYIQSSPVSVILYEPKKNLGYMNGLIAGYRYYRSIYSCPSFVIMSNTDISIPDNCFFWKLLSNKYDGNIGCIGPSVFAQEKRSYDNPVLEKRRTTREINNYIKFFSNSLIGGLYYYLSTIKGHFIKNRKTSSRYVYEVHGCYFILTGLFAEKIKDVEYGAFLYSEETFIAELILKYGFKTYYDSELEVNHLEHSTTKFVKCAVVSKLICESMTYIRNEFYRGNTEK